MAQLPLHFDGCLLLAPIANTLEPLINTSVGQAIVTSLSPQIDQALQNLLPRPLGIEGLIDSGALVQAISPGTRSQLEVRAVPGGYVDLHGGGLSIGPVQPANR